jgi:hypothetical protein
LWKPLSLSLSLKPLSRFNNWERRILSKASTSAHISLPPKLLCNSKGRSSHWGKT